MSYKGLKILSLMQRWSSKREMMGDDPPYLAVGTEVSAKYKGAFCEAKVRKIVRSVKCKIAYKLGLGTAIVTDDQIKGTLRAGSVVEVKHADKKEYMEATIIKIQDCSQYTVVFDDGDITTLRRTALCLKSGRHFAESETLDQLPLTHPEHFGNPVIGGRRGRRNRHDDSSDDEEHTKKGKQPKEEKEADIGKVVCVEMSEKKKQKDNWFPGLVVAPTAQDTVKINVKEDYLVRSFKDGRYFTVPKKEATPFTREIGLKVDNNTLRTAVDKALLFLDRDELPPHWDRELLFGLNEVTDTDSDGAFDSDTSDDEPREEKDHFVAQLYKFMDDRGTPINKGPTINTRDVDLYKLFKVVHKLGGYNRVTNHNQWKTVSHKLGFGQNPTSVNLVKHAYKKFLHSFEDFYRKLGCTMVNHPRGHRSRHRSGRSLIRDKDKALPSKEKQGEKDGEEKEETIVEPSKEKETIPKEEPKPKEVVSEPVKPQRESRKESQRPRSDKGERKEDVKVLPSISKVTEPTTVITKVPSVATKVVREEKVKVDDREERIKTRDMVKLDSNVKDEPKVDKDNNTHPKITKELKSEESQRLVKVTRREVKEHKKDEKEKDDKSKVVEKEAKPKKAQPSSSVEIPNITEASKLKKPRSFFSKMTGSKRIKPMPDNKLPRANKPLGLNAVRQKRTFSERMKAMVKKFKLKTGVKHLRHKSPPPSESKELEEKKKLAVEEKKKPVLEDKKKPVPDEKKKPVPEEKKKPVPEEKKRPVPEEKKKLVPEEKKKPVPEEKKKPVPEEKKKPVPEEKKKPVPEEKKKIAPEEKKKPVTEESTKVAVPQLTRSKSKEEVYCKLRKPEVIHEKKPTAAPSTSSALPALPDKKHGHTKKRKEDEKFSNDETLDQLPNYKTVSVGDKLKVYYGPTHESKVTYEAKVLNLKDEDHERLYLVHYTGWNTRYDEWIKRSRIADNLSWTPGRAKRTRQQKSQSQGRVVKRSKSGEVGGGGGPRSTTPSSVTSSSSRTKSPAVSGPPRHMRSRAHTRRTSGHTHTDFSESDMEDDYESDDTDTARVSGSKDMCDQRLSSDEKDSKDVKELLLDRMRSRSLRRRVESGCESEDTAADTRKTKEESEEEGRFERTRSRSEKRKSEEVTKTSPPVIEEIKKEAAEIVRSDRLRNKRRVVEEKNDSGDEREREEIKVEESNVQKVFNEEKRKSDTKQVPTEFEKTQDDVQEGDCKKKLKRKLEDSSFEEENKDTQPNERRRSRRVTPRKDDTKLIAAKDEEEQPRGREFDLNQIRSELKGITPSSKVSPEVVTLSDKEEDSDEKIDVEDITIEENEIKKEPDSAPEDIYEFKEPEPFEFEVRSKCGDEKGNKIQRRTFGRMCDEPNSTSPISVRKKLTRMKSESPTSLDSKRSNKKPIIIIEDEEIDKVDSEPECFELKKEPELKRSPRPCSPQGDKKEEKESEICNQTSAKSSSVAKIDDIFQPLCLFSDLPGGEETGGMDEDSEGRLVISEPETETESQGPLFSHQQRDHEDFFPTSITQPSSVENSKNKSPFSGFTERVKEEDEEESKVEEKFKNENEDEIEDDPIISAIQRVQRAFSQSTGDEDSNDIDLLAELPDPSTEKEKELIETIKDTDSNSESSKDSSESQNIENLEGHMSHSNHSEASDDDINDPIEETRCKVIEEINLDSSDSEADDALADKEVSENEAGTENDETETNEIEDHEVEDNEMENNEKDNVERDNIETDNNETYNNETYNNETYNNEADNNETSLVVVENEEDKGEEFQDGQSGNETENESKEEVIELYEKESEGSQIDKKEVKEAEEECEVKDEIIEDSQSSETAEVVDSDKEEEEEEEVEEQVELDEEVIVEAEEEKKEDEMEEEENEEYEEENNEESEVVKEEVTEELDEQESKVMEVKEVKEEPCEVEEAESNLDSLLCEETIPGSPAPSSAVPVENPPSTSPELPFASAAGSHPVIYKPPTLLISLPPPPPPPLLPPPPPPAPPVVNEAAPVMENTPPTTPESSLSPISNSPRGERSGSSPVPENESSKSNRDSSEVDMDGFSGATKICHYSEEGIVSDADTNCGVANTNTTLKKVGATDGTESQGIKKRRRSHKREENIKRLKMSHRSPRHNTGSESDDDTSENSLDLLSLHSRSPRPSKYNFFVQLDPELDGSQRIAVLQQKLAELRKTYMSVKAELACIDRRRKKLRRREREASVKTNVKAEVPCS